ncbi:hypothetical protein AZ78_4199 [Lysobacter capsici AZ78]|uniref:Uncharacterized protein n=1 Tax=Lysobacter capsici AZ78 TaxID=1444315 RepID=A0A108UCG8_9GAMM|nr:hypothetical protein AZ78_4199 [Lysobacter capsici AZ78]
MSMCAPSSLSSPITALRHASPPVHVPALNAGCTDATARRRPVNFANRRGTEFLSKAQPRPRPRDVTSPALARIPS